MLPRSRFLIEPPRAAVQARPNTDLACRVVIDAHSYPRLCRRTKSEFKGFPSRSCLGNAADTNVTSRSLSERSGPIRRYGYPGG